MNMVDTHCHILPGLDDGAKDWAEALQMAQLAIADGITDIVATPHTCNGIYENSAEVVLHEVNRFQKILDENNLPLRVHPGSEVHIHMDLIKNITTLRTLTICNHMKYILLELPVLNIPHCTENILQDLQRIDVTAIIAHPERNLVLQKNPAILAEWINQYSSIGQLSASSLLGKKKSNVNRTAKYMIENQLIHLISSDGHNVTSRPPRLKQVYQVFSTKQKEIYQWNAQAIVSGGTCQISTPIISNRRKFFC